MNKLIVAVLGVAIAGPAIAQKQSAHTDDLLHFEWLTEAQRKRVEQAHSQLAAAHKEVCDVMADTYAEHAKRVHKNELAGDDLAYCAAKSFANHIEMSVSLHDRIHREMHGGE